MPKIYTFFYVFSSVFIIVLSILLVRKLTPQKIFIKASESNIVSSCVYNFIDNYQDPMYFPNCEAVLNSDEEYVCALLAQNEGLGCITACENEIGEGNPNCDTACNIISDDIDLIDSNCTSSLDLCLKDNSGSCQDINIDCDYSENLSVINYCHQENLDCYPNNLNKTVCDTPLTFSTNNYCLENCSTESVDSIECHDMCTRRNENSCNTFCQTLNNSDSGSRPCSDICNFFYINGDTSPPTLNDWYGNTNWNSTSYDDWGDIDDVSGISSIEYQLNGGSWQACSHVIGSNAYHCVIQDLLEGENTIHVRATDNANNTNDNNSWVSYVITYNSGSTPTPDPDNSPPNLTWINSASNAVGTTFVFIGQGTDASTITDVEYSVNNGTSWNNCTTSNNFIDFTCQVQDIQTTSVNVIVRGTDQHDNINTDSTWISVQITNNDPILFPSSPTVIGTNSTISFGGTYFSAIGISSVQFRQSNPSQGPQENWNNCSTTISSEFTCQTLIENHNRYFFETRAIDTQGNITPQLGNYYIYGDFNNQTISWWPLENSDIGITTNGSIGTTLGEYNNGLLFNQNNQLLIIPDNSQTYSFSNSNSRFTVDFWVWPSSAGTLEGNYYNLIGKRNSDDSGFSWEILIDSTGSVMTAIYPNNDRQSIGEFSNDTKVNLNSWNHIVFSYDYMNDLMSIKVNNNSLVTDSIQSTSYLPSSTQPVIISYDNFSGAIDDILMSNLAYETNPPIINITPINNPQRLTDNTPTIAATVSDQTGIEEIEYLFLPSDQSNDLDNESWEQLNSNFSGSTSTVVNITPGNELSDGEWFLYIRAVDVNGNKSIYNNDGWLTSYGTSTPYIMAYYRIVIETTDTTPPNIYAHAIIPNPTIDKNIVIHGFVKDYLLLNEGDSTSNINSISYQIDGGSWVNIQPIDEHYDSPLEEFTINTVNLSLGEHTIVIKATDQAGNDTSTIALGEPHSNYTDTFEVTSPSVSVGSTIIIKQEDFSTNTNMDRLYTNGIWGNGYARLKQSIGYTTTNILFTNYSDWGYEFGNSNLNIFPADDENYLWVTTNNGGYLYINKSNSSYTRYSNIIPGVHISNIMDVGISGHQYLIVSHELYNPTYIIDTNNTPTNIDDDTQIQYSTDSSMPYTSWKPYSLDTRNGNLAIWAIITTNDANVDDFIVRINTNETPMDSSDDTYTYFNRSMGLLPSYQGTEPTVDFVTADFDNTTGLHILASYDWGIFVCSDNNNPGNQASYSCSAKVDTNHTAYGVFSITKDSNDWYWLAGNQGIKRVKINDTVTQTDDEWNTTLSSSDISEELPQTITWHSNTYPVGDEINFITREGHLRSLEYNSTYDSVLDDTSYDYPIPTTLYRNGGNINAYFENANTIWLVTQSKGLSRIDLSRQFEDSNTIEFYPIPPEGVLAINHVKFDLVEGDVSSGSSHVFSDLISYQISNDAGTNWQNITPGQTIDFSNPDYKLKFRMVLTKGSTPIVDTIQLSYTGYSDPNDSIIVSNNGESSNNSSSNNNNSNNNVCHDTAPGYKRPYIYKATPIGKDKVALFFNPGDKPYTKYTVVYGTKPDKYIYSGIDVATANDNYITVGNLKRNTKYYFRIIPFNGCAPGPKSNEITAKTNLTNISFIPAGIKISKTIQKMFKNSSDLNSIQITVKDSNNSPAANTDVIFNNITYRLNDNGQVAIYNITPGIYNLTITERDQWVNKKLHLSKKSTDYKFDFTIQANAKTIFQRIKYLFTQFKLI